MQRTSAPLRYCLLTIAALFAVGCAPAELFLDAPEPGDELALEVDGRWSAEERAAIAAALEDWRKASAGRLAVHIAAPGEDADATLLREHFDGMSGFDRGERTITIDGDVLAAEGFGLDGVRALTAHNVARMVGMRTHGGPRGVLARENVTSDITLDDLESCRASGYCD